MLIRVSNVVEYWWRVEAVGQGTTRRRRGKARRSEARASGEAESIDHAGRLRGAHNGHDEQHSTPAANTPEISITMTVQGCHYGDYVTKTNDDLTQQ